MSSLMDPLRHRAPTPPQYAASFGPSPLTNGGGSTNGHPPAPNGNTNGTRKPSPGGESSTTFPYANGATGGGAASSRVPCVNCGTLETPLWRRTPEGNPICNACGLYQKSRNMPRPASLSPTTAAHPAQPHTVASLAATAANSAHANSAPNTGASASASANPPATHPAAYAAHNSHNTNAAAPGQGGGGTCPGDGRCDGTGGTSACSGCPTWNNSARLTSTTNANSTSPKANSSPNPNAHGTGGGQGGAQQGGGTGGNGQEEPASMRQILNPTPPPQGGSPGYNRSGESLFF
ncbi:GATA zinc finger-domain-containing protein [Mycena metata]|uniref:GATA zinc finger-domain-containing protein n=1 Tax=Mycena metata TaxID=1033252 RepID=A0AAD7NVV5_9AGAR|nr:GATA zinc finger-domain-containing protein [Mycena metata]